MENFSLDPITLGKNYFVKGKHSFFLVGINYMPSKSFYRIWEEWDPSQLEEDFKRIRDLGAEAVRVPLFWGSVEPAEGVISQTFLERFDEFLRIANKHHVYVMPFLFVGVCVDIWDVPWRQGRNIYKDPEMLRLECKQAETLAARYADNPAIIAWDMSDEPYYYAGVADEETATNWVSSIYKAIKSCDEEHPVTLGFDNHHIVEDTGVQIEKLTPQQDFFSLCAYPIYGLKTPEAHTSTRSTYFTSFFVKFSDVGKPVLLSEGPGTTTVWTSPERAGEYFKVVMYSSFVNNSIGVMPWILYDYSAEHHAQFPLDEKPFETSFGILTSSGEKKPPAEELKQFSQVIKKIDLEKFHFRKPEAGLLIPKDYYRYVKTIWPRLFEAYILAREAHIELDFVREGADLAGYKLVMIPSGLVLRTSSWYALKKYVEQNGTLYFSYGGSMVGAPNPLGPFFNEIFGVELQDRIAPVSPEELMLTENWMNLKGHRFRYPKTDGASCLEVEPNKGHVIAHDGHKNPAIIVNKQKGRGAAVLVSHPVENYLSALPDVYLSDKTFLIYEALKKASGLSCPYVCDNPFIEVGWMESDGKEEAIIILINHERTKIKTSILLDQNWHLTVFPSGKSYKCDAKEKKTLMRLSFSPSEVKVFHALRKKE